VLHLLPVLQHFLVLRLLHLLLVSIISWYTLVTLCSTWPASPCGPAGHIYHLEEYLDEVQYSSLKISMEETFSNFLYQTKLSFEMIKV
jgi:hypothetical protein